MSKFDTLGGQLACRGVLFDCDGVLVDSDASVARAWRRWARTYGLPPEEVVGMVHGRRSADTVGLLIDEQRRGEALDTIDRYELDDAGTVPAVPGAERLTRTMPPGSWAIVTSGVTALARARLRAAAIPEPAALITAESVSKGKPAPDGYLAAARALGLAVGDTVALEDSAAGVAAARAAGVRAVVGVGARALETDADAVVGDLRRVRWTPAGLAYDRSAALR